MSDTKQQIFMKLYESCHEPFLRYCSALAYGKMDTQDLVQDVLLSAYIHFDSIHKKEELLHYLIRAARNRSISIWRKRRKETEMKESYTRRLLAKGVSPEVLIDIDIVYKALNKLPHKQNDALVLFEICGFSIKEISAIQQRSVGAIKTNLSRGRKKLRDYFSEKEEFSGSTFNAFSVIKAIVL